MVLTRELRSYICTLEITLHTHLVLRGCAWDFQADFTLCVKWYVAFLRNFYVEWWMMLLDVSNLSLRGGTIIFHGNLELSKKSSIVWPNFMWLPAILFEIWILFKSEFLLQTDRQTDRRTESDAYEPTVPHTQVGSKNETGCFHSLPGNPIHSLLNLNTQ